jgi:hypothetical protein
MIKMLRTKPLFFSILCILCLSSLPSFSTVKSQISFSNVRVNADGSIEASTGPIEFKGDVYTLTDNIYNVTFVESGLPSGTQWEAILNGTQHFSTTNRITFDNVSAATYLWSIPNAVAPNLHEGNGTVYSVSPPSGGISIAPYFLNIAQQITFYPVSTSPPSPSPTPTVPEFPSLTIPIIIVLAVVAVTQLLFGSQRKNPNLNQTLSPTKVF